MKHWTPPQDNPTRPGFAVKIVRRAIVPGNSVPHVDYIDPAGVIPFVTALGDTRVDIMLESRMKDAALMRLRDDLTASGLNERIW